MVELEPYDVLAVVNEVWLSFLGDSVCLQHPSQPLDFTVDVLHVTVRVSGGLDAVVRIELPGPAAFAVARTMFRTEVVYADVVDAVGELANIIGGNIKGLLAGQSKLSLPEVTHWEGAAPPLPAGALRADFDWAGHPLRVVAYVEPAA
jgi:chemotaxis protein CheX